MISKTLSFTDAKIAASKLLNDFAVTSARDIDLEIMAADRGAFIRRGGITGAEARLTRRDSRGIIRIREDIPEKGRERFDIAHELGHWELHRGRTQLKFCTDNDIQGYVNSPMELEASAFAAHLLLPPRLIGAHCNATAPDLQLVKDLAEEFTTTLTTTVGRVVEESRTHCVAVFSENGEVRRWRRRQDNGPNVWLASRQEIHPNSIAAKCADGSDGLSQMAEVPVAAWFPAIHTPDFRLFEQSMRLGRYPTVLTLLRLVYE